MITEKEYLLFLRTHHRAIAQLKLDFNFFLEEVGPIHIISFEHRLKSYDSAITKSAKLGVPIYDIDDLAGFSVIVGTSSEQRTVRHFFRDGLRGKSFEVIKDQKISRSDGYRAHHLVLGTDLVLLGHALH